MLRTADLEYHLPEELIASRALEPRDSARLLVVDRAQGSGQDRTVRDLPDLLVPGDVLVLNSTRVLPARFLGRRAGTGGRCEGLFLEDAPAQSADGTQPAWICLLRGGHLRPGAQIELDDQAGSPSGVTLRLLAKVDQEPGAWQLAVAGAAPGERSWDVLARVGRTPLPPYILKARAKAGLMVDDLEDRRRYQTVFARQIEGSAGIHGSVAAPTAGLHLTPELLARLHARGIQLVNVTLHVGTGTFRSVETEFVEQHPMHGEWCSMAPEAISAIRKARAHGRRIIPVGSTSARTLESYANLAGDPPSAIQTRMLITPGYAWKWCDGMLTNFHLPRSTLMAMVGAMLEGGVDRLVEIYARAISERYRFYSYGDAMLILP